MKNKLFVLFILIIFLLSFLTINVNAASNQFTLITYNGMTKYYDNASLGITWAGLRDKSGEHFPTEFEFCNGKVFYESYPVTLNDEPVNEDDVISNTVTYVVKGCNHDYRGQDYPTTCGAYTTHYTCFTCSHSYIEHHEATFEDHSYVYSEIRSAAPTCSDYGYEAYVCRACGNEYTEFIPPDQDNHNLDFIGNCTICDYSTFGNFISNVGNDIENGWNSIIQGSQDLGNNIADTTESVIQDVKEHFDNIKTETNITIDKILTLIFGVIFIIVLVYFAPLAINGYKKIFRSKKNVWKNKRR